jgi:DNA-binding transcriptional LysR family regulator
MDFDLYCLRIFYQVIKDGSFSAAARTLRITQPTVSQKIAGLESDLGKKLFERVGHEIHLTNTGRELSQFAQELLEKAERFSDQIRNNQASPSGLVRYAMPESCQWTPHYRKIMAQITEFPKIQFDISILPSEQIVDGLLQGTYDFGFIVGERLNPELRFEKFSDEKYSAVAADRKLLKPLIDLNISELRIISYPGWDSFFTTWAKAFGIWEKVKNRLQTPTVKIGTLAGAIHATQEGAGIAIIPTHCVATELSEKSLIEYSVGRRSVASSPVHVARRTGEKLPTRVELVLNLLRKAKQELG